MRDIFIIHHSVFNDAFRKDYNTQYRDSSKNFFQLLLNHTLKHKNKIAFTSGEVFGKLNKSPIGKTNTIWIIPEYLVEIDFSSYFKGGLELTQSVIKLASKKCITTKPVIVSTKKDINLEGTNFVVLTPAEAIEYYNHPNSLFKK